MCIRCSGIHRNLGVHISFVRSVSLDEWKASQVKVSADAVPTSRAGDDVVSHAEYGSLGEQTS